MTTELAHDSAWLTQQQRAWEAKPLLRSVYGGFHKRIEALIDRSLPGKILEVGAGIGCLKDRLQETWATDLLPNPKLDFVSSAYELPLPNGSMTHLVLIDVFHHLAVPGAFLAEAQRVLTPGGRLILLEPYMSLCSFPVYGLLHPEPIGWRKPIDLGTKPPQSRAFYAAQGNATRLFFNHPKQHALDWIPFHREAFAGFAYLLCGGFSRPSLYPAFCFPALNRIDQALSKWPRLFGARCLLGFRKPLDEAE